MVRNYAPLSIGPAKGSSFDRRRSERRHTLSLCWILLGEQLLTVKLGDISATGAYLITTVDIPLETTLVLRHPVAGQIEAHVVRKGEDGIGIAFSLSEASVGFTLRAVTADMTQSPPHTH
jgi:hypothetical protein